MRTLTEQEEQGRRLREARSARFKTATEGWNHVKRFVKVSKQTYIQHENGTRGYGARAFDYAKAFDTTGQWLLKGATSSAAPIELPVVGKVAAGIEGHFHSDYIEGDGGETIIFDPDDVSMVLEISGDSMLPRYRSGDKVICGNRYEDPTPFIRHDVMVQTADGRKLFKTLRKGSQPGLWDLYSINPAYDPIRDVALDWIVPVKYIVV